MWRPVYVLSLCVVAFICVLHLITSADAISCHICNSNANKTCNKKLFANFSKVCSSNAIGCRKLLTEDELYGFLVVRSCYNNTYKNHTALFGQFTRDSCTESYNSVECICDTDNCNDATFPWQHPGILLTLTAGIFLSKLV
ncbi:uncharacterized protein LOC133191543 [Saccostrea echinata]|uniref:uncharacterized protein LOC133191543 n=1 Tax=Saccostrea echinata TaxID=191078 RepID=UPI002A816376|nr:uncharacterized protein LOC133191543 [Saccostrea echinata]